MISEEDSNSIGTIRRADQSDIPALLHICRESFPESLRWRSPRHLGRKWWHATLASKSCETWICLNNSKAAGFCVLITQPEEDLEFAKSRKGSFTDRLFAILSHPILTCRKIKKRIRLTAKRSSDAPKPVSAETRPNDNPIWLDLIAVAPNERGQGLAKKMLRLCIDRASRLKRTAIKLRINSDNLPARKLYESTGFLRTYQKANDCIHTKEINQQNSHL